MGAKRKNVGTKYNQSYLKRARKYNNRFYRRNRKKILENARKRYDPKKHKELNLRRYGITIQQFNILSEVQNGLCAVCKQTEKGKTSRYLSVDHNHQTGKVRGLLCHQCNIAIGCIKEDIKRAENIIIYLKQYAN